MTEFSWCPTDVPDGMAVRQVYGLLFDGDGRVMLLVDGARHHLPGGHPEPGDVSWSATLRRECREEGNVEISEPVYLGFQRVDKHDGSDPYAQVRMVARIERVGRVRPDPDTGRIYQRCMTSAARTGDLLAWGEIGRRQVKAAAQRAAHAFGVHRDRETPDGDL